MTGSRRRSAAGFTLVEVMIAMVAGVVVLGASTTLVLGTMRSMRGTELRDGIDRRARFIGIALQRDVQQTGIAIDSRPTFGTIGTYADTLVTLRVPFFWTGVGTDSIPADSYVRSALVPAASGVGNCGAFCLEVTRPVGPAFQIAAGQLAYVELNSVRRLIRVTAVAFPSASLARVTFANTANILGHPAGVVGLDLRKVFTVRTLRVTAFYRDAANRQLVRADSTTTTGAPVPQVIATGVANWQASLVFTNGVEADVADADTPDGNPDNNYDDIARVHLWASLEADRTDPRFNNGVLLTRRYDWWLSPRNLMYERNKL